jgi:hypothetical protein
MKQSVYLGEFALSALAGEKAKGSGADPAANLVSAIRVYLSDANRGHPGWSIPEPPPENAGASEVRLELDIDAGLWAALEVEAAEQGVSPSRLASHASLYYAAELSSGRLTRRIADDLDREGD